MPAVVVSFFEHAQRSFLTLCRFVRTSATLIGFAVLAGWFLGGATLADKGLRNMIAVGRALDATLVQRQEAGRIVTVCFTAMAEQFQAFAEEADTALIPCDEGPDIRVAVTTVVPDPGMSGYHWLVLNFNGGESEMKFVTNKPVRASANRAEARKFNSGIIAELQKVNREAIVNRIAHHARRLT